MKFTVIAMAILVCGAQIVVGQVGSAPATVKVSGVWQQAANMSVTRLNFTSTVLGDKVLVAGGDSLGPFIFPSAKIYEARVGTWSPTASMSQGHSAHTATLLRNEKVLIAGGNNPNDDLTVSELYDPLLGSWSVTGG